MGEPPGRTAMNRALLTSLGVLLIFILGLLVALAAYPLILPPAPTPVRITVGTPPSPTNTPTATFTPTVTRTRRPTFTPTITLTPTKTSTPTLTPTPTGPATLTPAVAHGDASNYLLQEWSAEKADDMAALMEDYPNTLPQSARGEKDQNYYQAFRFGVLALQEALLRFPSAPQAKAWRWRLAFAQANLGASEAGSTYAELISSALNTGETDVDGMKEWFHLQEPRLVVTTTQLSAPANYLSANLVEVGGAGSAFILLLEKPGGFQAQTLFSQFDFAVRTKYRAFNADLNGDKSNEIIIFQTHPSETERLSLPRVFSLASLPAQELNFAPEEANFSPGMDYANRWEAAPNSGGFSDLRWRTRLFPACPLEITRRYTWENNLLQLAQADYRVRAEATTMSYCQFLVEHAANAWGPAAAIEIMSELLPEWPPEKDENGKPYPSDARDEWRYRLGVYTALVGQREKALSYFKEIIQTPASANSRWVKPAQRFLNIYTKEEELYRACVQADYCDPRLAIAQLARMLPRDAYPMALSSLWQGGVAQRTSGYFDFDGDGVKESWFTVRHHEGEKLDFFILAAARSGVRAIFVESVESNQPKLTYLDEKSDQPVVLIDGSHPFRLERLPGSLEPYLRLVDLPQTYPNRFQEGVDAAQEALFAGEKPSKVEGSLEQLQEYPGLICRATWSCDEYNYTLGLAAELAGDQTTAVNAYLTLWKDYLRSPFTTMARLKLRSRFATPTPSSTPTATSTATSISSPIALGTLTSTPTPTLSGTAATPLPTFTATPPTPYPITTTTFVPYP